jgi:hypothetical protein
MIHKKVQGKSGLKISHKKKKNATQGVGKMPKNCHVLFEWPHSYNKDILFVKET